MSLFILYLFGFNLSKNIYTSYKNKNRFHLLLKYPQFITRVLEDLNRSHLSFPGLLLLIVTTNISTMYMGFLAGFIPYLTYFFVFYLGINLGLTQLLLMPDKPLWILFMNPIALLEIPAILIAAAAGLSLGTSPYSYVHLKISLTLFNENLTFLLHYPVLILCISGILESWLVVLSRKIQVPQ